MTKHKLEQNWARINKTQYPNISHGGTDAYGYILYRAYGES